MITGGGSGKPFLSHFSKDIFPRCDGKKLQILDSPERKQIFDFLAQEHFTAQFSFFSPTYLKVDPDWIRLFYTASVIYKPQKKLLAISLQFLVGRKNEAEATVHQRKRMHSLHGTARVGKPFAQHGQHTPPFASSEPGRLTAGFALPSLFLWAFLGLRSRPCHKRNISSCSVSLLLLPLLAPPLNSQIG